MAFSDFPNALKFSRVCSVESDTFTISDHQREELNEITLQYFSKMGEKLGCALEVKHTNGTVAHPLTKQRNYPVSPYIQTKINRELHEMLSLGVVERI